MPTALDKDTTCNINLVTLEIVNGYFAGKQGLLDGARYQGEGEGTGELKRCLGEVEVEVPKKVEVKQMSQGVGSTGSLQDFETKMRY